MDRRLVRRRGGRRIRLGFLILVLVFVVSVSTVVGLYTDLLWYREVGFASVFWTVLGSKLLIAGTFGLLFFLFSLANLVIVNRVMPVYRLAFETGDPVERYRGAVLPYLRVIALGVSALLALLFALTITPYWERALLALNMVPFGEKDALLAKDLGFYVFRLPFYRFLYGWGFSSLVVVILMVGFAHYLTGGIRLQPAGDRVTPQVKAHLSALLGLAVLLRAWGYRLDQFDLLYSTRGEIIGASYTDVHAERPALTLLIIISVIVAGLFLVNIRARGWALPLAGAGLLFLISILARGAFPYFIQRFTVEPAELQKETPYIERNVKATRAAFGIDSIEVREHPVITGISPEAVSSNPETINNIRLWDPQTLATAYQQLQEIRTYYQFADVDVDRYTLDGRTRQVLLSVRELAPQELETKTWQNLHIVYTHGYGAVVSPTNETNPEGGPSFLVQDVPPRTNAPELETNVPGIYYGERLRGEYSLVRTKQQELDYVSEAGNTFTTYEGKGGVKASGLLRRLAFGWRFRNLNLAISGLINEDSRVIYYRQVQERLEKVAPFLHFDGDPYPVVADGRIVWIADAYTVSSMYPYSQRLDFSQRTGRINVNGAEIPASIRGQYNYVRNSVKATVDAYDGTVRLYVWDSNDPILAAWRKIFPDIFTDGETMPPSIRQHVRYPEDLFRIQSHIYRRYHMTVPSDFYTQEDLWVIPGDPDPPRGAAAARSSVVEEIQPFYVLMRLPGETQEEYVLILPMNPRGKGNMVSWLAAKSGPDDYGKLIDFRFPKGRLIQGVGQIHARINSTPEIARTVSLLDQLGSEVVWGNLLVMPVQDSILYVQPLFVQASERNAIPELAQVILATSERVVMGSSMEDGLRLLLEGGPAAPTVVEAPAGTDQELVRIALEHLRAAEEAARQGDWATFGRELQSAREALEEANR
jgi:uncharacterized membrane protein (UPF0182 family)